MLVKYFLLALFCVSSVMAAELTRKEKAKTLVAAKDEDLEKTFKKFEEQDKYELSRALADMANSKDHMPKVAKCLEIAEDPYKKESSRVSRLIHNTVYEISDNTSTDT